MDAKLLPSSVCNAASIFASNLPPKPTRQTPIHLPVRRRRLLAASDSGTANGGEEGGATDERQPPSTPTIRYVSRSRKRRAKQQGGADQYRQKPPPPAKEWEEMTLGEKAAELYVGEKGVLFWLNKIAYASIFVIVGVWILFRFVGPALNLYQLDGRLLSPDSIFKASP